MPGWYGGTWMGIGSMYGIKVKVAATSKSVACLIVRGARDV